MKALTVALVLFATSASAQTFAPGAAVYPSPPLGRHFLDQPVATCVIATPVSVNAVMLTPCPPGTLVPPAAAQLPTPTPPTTPPVAAPKEAEAPREPVVIRIEVVPVAPEKPAPKAAPKAAPKKTCPC